MAMDDLLARRMKRGALYTCCRENGYNKLVLAQHLDDLAESFMMSALHNGQVSRARQVLCLLPDPSLGAPVVFASLERCLAHIGFSPREESGASRFGFGIR